MKKEAFWEAHILENLQKTTGAPKLALKNLINYVSSVGRFSHSEALKVLSKSDKVDIKKLLNLLKTDDEQPDEMIDEGNILLHDYTPQIIHDREPAGIMPYTPLSIPAGTVA